MSCSVNLESNIFFTQSSSSSSSSSSSFIKTCQFHCNLFLCTIQLRRQNFPGDKFNYLLKRRNGTNPELPGFRALQRRPMENTKAKQLEITSDDVSVFAFLLNLPVFRRLLQVRPCPEGLQCVKVLTGEQKNNIIKTKEALLDSVQYSFRVHVIKKTVGYFSFPPTLCHFFRISPTFRDQFILLFLFMLFIVFL